MLVFINGVEALSKHANIPTGSIADLWDGPNRGKAMIFYILAPFLGPALGQDKWLIPDLLGF